MRLPYLGRTPNRIRVGRPPGRRTEQSLAHRIAGSTKIEGARAGTPPVSVVGEIRHPEQSRSPDSQTLCTTTGPGTKSDAIQSAIKAHEHVSASCSVKYRHAASSRIVAIAPMVARSVCNLFDISIVVHGKLERSR